MLTRSLYLAAIWFAISLFVTLMGGYRLRSRNIFLAIGWLAIVIVLGDIWALLTFGIPSEILIMSGVAFAFGGLWISLLPNWNAAGQVTWAMTLLATILFIMYSFMVTAFTPLNTLSFIIALDFFLIETLALLMALTHAYESFDLFCRVQWNRWVRKFPDVPGYTPMVSLHVPAYNEPPDVVASTLASLARLDYPNYEVLVVDNNTPSAENWLRIQKLSKDLGPRFRFVHLDRWPGYKSGALNFALAHTAPEAEIVGSIDADYIVKPDFLSSLVPYFANPKVGFVQAPQDYRYDPDDPFAESTYHGYKYFFEVSMPVRNEHNAIIFCGTMGLIRKSALQDIGGWDEWCITEDAEASLRILKLGYDSLYIKHSFGRGLMPYTFEGLKKQRFRWCFGGIQILKKHWGALMPWAHWLDPQNRLTLAQRYFYLVGGLQWFTDVLNLIFGFFLTIGAISSIFLGGRFSIRPLTGPLLIMPAVFLLLHLWRFLWVLRHALHLRVRTALRSMYNFFSLGWAVTLACFQGLIQKKGVFLRTPKSRSESKLLGALLVTEWENLIGLTFLGSGLAAFLGRPELKTLWLGLLLAWQSSLYLAAPYFSLLSIRSGPTPAPMSPDIDRGQPVLENRLVKWVWGTVAVVAILMWIAFQIPVPKRTNYAQYQPAEVPPAAILGVPTPAASPTPLIYPTPLPTFSPILPTPTLLPTQILVSATSIATNTSTSTPVPLPTSTTASSATPSPVPPTAVVVPTNTSAPPPTATAASPTGTAAPIVSSATP